MSIIEIKCKPESFRLVPIDSVTPNPRNNNRHSIEQLLLLEKLIVKHGFREPLTISNQTGFLNCGHARLEVAKKLGMTEVPVMFQDFSSKAEEYQHMTADNEIQRWSELDRQAVYDAMDEIPEIDIELLAIENFELPELAPEPQCDEDEVPENVETRCKPGDIWKLGNHRLMCGDSTSIDAVEKLMDGQKADMVFTDPPYGMRLDTDYSNNWGAKSASGGRLDLKDRKTKNHRPVIGDDKEFDFLTAYAIFEDCPEQFWWGADYYCQQLPKGCGWLVWDKTGGNDSLTNVGFNANFELVWSKQKHKRDLIKHTWKGVAGMKKEDGSRVHPTQKPVGLAEHFIKEWSKTGGNIIDIYGGSGTTLLASEKTARNCFMMELDPKYCDVILTRWENYTGKTAERIDGS